MVCESGSAAPARAAPPLAARGETPRCIEIGGAPAWQGATREQIGGFVTEEQRRHAGCSANRMQRGFHHGLLSPARTARTYRNCTELRRDHPNGVPRGHPAYRRRMDRDNDGRACER